MPFGDILRGLLEEQGISQKQLATDLNIAPSTLGNYIQNTREPDFATLLQLAQYFHVSTDYLLHNQVEPSATGQEIVELLRIYDALPKEQQKLMLEEGKLLLRLYGKPIK